MISKRIMAAALTAAVGSVGLAGTAVAAPSEPTGKACVLNTDNGVVRCFTSVAAANRYIDTGSADANERSGLSPMATSATRLAVLYTGYNGNGASLTLTSSNGCGYHAYSPYMPSGWDNVVSSVFVYEGCLLTLYTDPDYSGGWWQSGATSSAVNVGIDNQTSSYFV